ncbi:hypothetical protein [Corynebacterium lowii]|nr:hypothetical protein [Corynebacterium lowii]MDP9852438.1 hypothetical protein [Corynebacterium lowii]
MASPTHCAEEPAREVTDRVREEVLRLLEGQSAAPGLGDDLRELYACAG